LGDVDQQGLRQVSGFQDRERDRFVFVQGKAPDCLRQRAPGLGQLPADLCQELSFDPIDQPDKDVIKQGDLVGRQAVGVAQEKLGNLIEDVGPPLGRPSINRVQF
jgi:hypothetical protein